MFARGSPSPESMRPAHSFGRLTAGRIDELYNRRQTPVLQTKLYQISTDVSPLETWWSLVCPCSSVVHLPLIDPLQTKLCQAMLTRLHPFMHTIEGQSNDAHQTRCVCL